MKKRDNVPIVLNVNFENTFIAVYYKGILSSKYISFIYLFIPLSLYIYIYIYGDESICFCIVTNVFIRQF